MLRFEGVVYSLSRLLDRTARVAVVIMMVLVCSNVLLRLVWQPILGTYELVMVLGVAVVSLALANCAVQRGHVNIELVTDKLPQRTQVILRIIISILAIVTFALIAWQCGMYATDMWHSGQVSETLRVPFYPFIYVLGLSCLALSMVILIDFCKAVKELRSR